MKRTELCPKLNRPFKKGNDCGITKLTETGFENIWFVIPPPPPTLRPSNLPLKAVAKAHKTLDSLESFKNLNAKDRLILKLVLRQEAVVSSRLEGTWSTIDDIYTPYESLKANSDIDAQNHSVRSYANALEKCFLSVFKLGHAAFNLNLIQTLHKSIMSRDPHYIGKPGLLRKAGSKNNIVYIGGAKRKENSIYNPAPPSEVFRLTKVILNWYSDETLVEMGDAGMGLSLPLRIAIGHSHFEAIHPFRDGNGRVGRMLWPLQMIAAGKSPLYLSSYVEAYKDDYGASLQASQKKLNYGPIIEFICEAIFESNIHYLKIQSQIRKLPEKWQKQGQFRAQSASYRAVDLLLELPIITTKTLEKKLKVSPPAASQAIQNLVKANILTERTGFRRNRVFAANEVLKLLSSHI